ncbi:hypothetical protein TIFTF001_012566 [Ficus carica]|uniref:Uncharacterized protein n=1 Tax=Ficus carica TaxID=3494 RepID=A0AA88DI36_FICCA|nr:hypothetical protein TIFTF001_012566 [Ficus carica]
MNQFSGETAGSYLEILKSFAPAGFLIFESEEYKGKKETLANLCSGTNGVSNLADVTARMMDQLYDIEKVVAFLVYTFHSSTLPGEMLPAELANVITHLEQLKQNRKGRVPVVVYWAIDFLKGRIDVEMNEEEGETVDFSRFKLDDAVTIVEKCFSQIGQLPIQQ